MPFCLYLSIYSFYLVRPPPERPPPTLPPEERPLLLPPLLKLPLDLAGVEGEL